MSLLLTSRRFQVLFARDDLGLTVTIWIYPVITFPTLATTDKLLHSSWISTSIFLTLLNMEMALMMTS